MGQKINPISLRLQNTNRYFDFCWYNDFFYSDLISQDLKIENYLGSIFKQLHYPLGRFFIQNSQKKIKIFAFFCSPKKARKKKANTFKLNYYKKKIYNLKNTKISEFLREDQNLQYLPRSIISDIPKKKEPRKKIGVYIETAQKKVDKNHSIYFEEKLIYMKYLLYRNYLQSFFTSKDNTFFLPNWISFLEKKQKRFSTESNNYASCKPSKKANTSTILKFLNQNKIPSYNRLSGFDFKNINNLLSYRSDYLPVSIINRKLKKSKILTLTVLNEKKEVYPKKERSGLNLKGQLKTNKNAHGRLFYSKSKKKFK